MKQIVRTALVGWIIASLSIGTAAQTPGFSAADSKELAYYRLSMDTVKKVDAAMRIVIGEMKNDPKVQEMMKLEAEIETLEKKDELTDAEAERLEKLREKKEKMEEADDDVMGLDLNNADTIDEMEAGIKKAPQMLRALTKVGLTPREFSKFMLMSIMAGMVAGFQQSGMLKELPKELKEIHPDNIKFMIDHQAELEAMRKDLEKFGKGGLQ